MTRNTWNPARGGQYSSTGRVSAYSYTNDVLAPTVRRLAQEAYVTATLKPAVAGQALVMDAEWQAKCQARLARIAAKKAV